MDDFYNNIQWYPGHMAKAKKNIQESLKLVHLAAEIIDARIPLSSRNPVLNFIISNKPKIIVINKSDLADSAETSKWENYYKNNNIKSVTVNSKTGENLNLFKNIIKNLFVSKKIIKIMVLGIPNVGKSSFISKLTKKSSIKIENKPGVTKQIQWFSIDNKIDLLDTPGVLWPKFDNQQIGENLAFTGAIKDDILDIENLAVNFINNIKIKYINNLAQRFGFDINEIINLNSYEIINLIAQKRNLIVKNNQIDFLRASKMILNEFRSTKLGRITLEKI